MCYLFKVHPAVLMLFSKKGTDRPLDILTPLNPLLYGLQRKHRLKCTYEYVTQLAITTNPLKLHREVLLHQS